MSKHITPPPRADQTDKATEPDRRAPRFDERGIALQTVIIMVVLLAIAGTVAAVLLSSAGDATSELENQDLTTSVVDTPAECGATTWGGSTGNWSNANNQCTWTDTTASGNEDVTAARCQLAGGVLTTASNKNVCTSPR